MSVECPQKDRCIHLEDVGILVPALRVRLRYVDTVISALDTKLKKSRADLADGRTRLAALLEEEERAISTASEFAESTIMRAILTTEELGARLGSEITKLKSWVTRWQHLFF
jgi:hypothetical protein